MTPERQRIAIAEWCGWRRESGINPWTDEMCHWRRPDNVGVKDEPDYLRDLNAMHDATEKLTDDQRVEFCIRLNEVVRRGKAVGDGIRTFENIQARAYQRAEALLRTIGKWED